MSESSEKAQLYLLIAGKYYVVDRIAFDRENPNHKGWKLTHFKDPLKHGPYDVVRMPSGRITCQCGDFDFVKQKVGGTCKHIDALKQIGLFQS